MTGIDAKGQARRLLAAAAREGDPERAIAALEAALAIDPRLAVAYKNLAALHATAGRPEAARQVLERAVAAVPDDALLRVRLALAQAALGDSASALATADAAEALAPTDARAWCDIGRIRAERWRWEEAGRALDEAARRDPGLAEIETLRAIVKQEAGDTAGALLALESATRRDPGDLRAAVAARLLLPQVYQDEADLARWRERYRTGLASLAADAPRWLPRARDAFRLDHQNFLLAYQGENDRELQRGYSSFLARHAEAVHPEWRTAPARTYDGGRRLRVGFASSIFRECTAGRYFERWITGLEPARFERFVYHTASVDDAFTQRIASSVEHFATLRTTTEALAARLAADRLDAIVYPEVGMMPSTNMLAALRLAPLQWVGWGHPVTTGSDAIDGFLTAAAMEPPDAAGHYVEPRVELPGIGVDYGMPTPTLEMRRETFGFAASTRLYVCAQSLFKIHPAMDPVFASLLEADPDAALVFFQAPVRAVTMQFATRLERSLAARGIRARRQLKFLPRMNGAGFRGVLALADVVLDTFHWSGGNTSLDAFAAGAPVVTLPGRFMRGRQTAAMLAMMGLDELVAATGEDYVRIAMDAARDRDRNVGLRAAIVANRGTLFDRSEAVAAFARRLLAAAAKT